MHMMLSCCLCIPHSISECVLSGDSVIQVEMENHLNGRHLHEETTLNIEGQ